MIVLCRKCRGQRMSFAQANRRHLASLVALESMVPGDGFPRTAREQAFFREGWLERDHENLITTAAGLCVQCFRETVAVVAACLLLTKTVQRQAEPPAARRVHPFDRRDCGFSGADVHG